MKSTKSVSTYSPGTKIHEHHKNVFFHLYFWKPE